MAAISPPRRPGRDQHTGTGPPISRWRTVEPGPESWNIESRSAVAMLLSAKPGVAKPGPRKAVALSDDEAVPGERSAAADRPAVRNVCLDIRRLTRVAGPRRSSLADQSTACSKRYPTYST